MAQNRNRACHIIWREQTPNRGRGVQVGPMHPLWICKISEIHVISPIKYLRHLTASMCCPCWTPSLDTTHFQKRNMYVYIYKIFVQCYAAHYVIKVLILRSWQRRFPRLCVHRKYTHYVYKSIIYAYKRMYIYTPALEAAAPTVFMVWPRAWTAGKVKKTWQQQRDIVEAKGEDCACYHEWLSALLMGFFR